MSGKKKKKSARRNQTVRGDNQIQSQIQTEYDHTHTCNNSNNSNNSNSNDSNNSNSNYDDTNGEFAYSLLLDRAFYLLRLRKNGNNINNSNESNKELTSPDIALAVARIGTTRTVWINFYLSCQAVNRKEDHVQSYLLSEFVTSGSIDKKNRLVLKGRFSVRQIESVWKKYLVEYVRCNHCHSFRTNINRENDLHISFIECENCHSKRQLIPIASPFRATSRRDRRLKTNK